MSGYGYVLDSVGDLKRHPSHRGFPLSALSLEDEYNIALQHAVEGAAILRNLGLELFSAPVRGRTLNEAVTWWAGEVMRQPPSFQGNRAWSHNWHLGWIPIYLRFHPSGATAEQLRNLERRVTSGRSPRFRAVSLGGATNCLW